MATTWNPSDKSAGTTLSGGNLVASFASGSPGVRSIDRVYTGKYYWENTFTTFINTLCGVALGGVSLTAFNNTTPPTYCAICTGNSGNVWVNGTNVLAGIGGTFPNGWVCCIALDATNDLIWFRNGAAGTWNNNAANDPATGVGGFSIAAFTAGPMGIYAAANGGSGSGVITTNFGASAFVGAVPSGYTSGFPDSTVVNNIIMDTGVVRETMYTVIPALQESGIAREVLYTITPALTASQVVREVLVSTPTALTVASVVREVLMFSPIIRKSLQTGVSVNSS
jgi:hypothetical protein